MAGLSTVGRRLEVQQRGLAHGCSGDANLHAALERDWTREYVDAATAKAIEERLDFPRSA